MFLRERILNRCQTAACVRGSFQRISLVAALLLCVCSTVAFGQSQREKSDSVLATVGRRKITLSEVELFKVRRGIPGKLTPELKKRLLTLLIDRCVVENWLAKKVKIDRRQLARQVALTRTQIKRSGKDPDTFFKTIGISDKQLAGLLEGTVRWNLYVAGKLSNDAIRGEFRRNRARYNDTRVRARQILIKAKPGDTTARQMAIQKLRDAKQKAAGSESAFEELAKSMSQSPSAKQGGDVGFFAWQGQMPSAVAAAAFKLKIGDISDPIESPFGVHLLKVTDRREGTLSPEDARPQIVEVISQQEWNAILEREKKKATIEVPLSPAKSR